jgi:hypothetical protein
MPKTHETIIIGAGMAGLGCARTLHKKELPFLIITEDIGGRILTSEDGKINYGAYFVLNHYKHVLKFCEKRRKLKPFNFDFHGKKEKQISLFRIFLHPIEGIRILYILFTFKRHYFRFKKTCEHKSQKEALEEYPELKELYFNNAHNFIKDKGIQYLSENFFGETSYGCCFKPLREISAFDFLRVALGFIIPFYEFVFHKEKAIKGFEKNIQTETVVKIILGTTHKIKTESGRTYTTKNLVVALPPHISKRLLHLKKIKKPSSAYMYHFSGVIKDKWEGDFEWFRSNHQAILFREQEDGTYLLYSKNADEDLSKYVQFPKLIAKKHWKPAFNITGNFLIENKLQNNTYLIGDFNLGGLEACYITGIYAANQIIKNAK